MINGFAGAPSDHHVRRSLPILGWLFALSALSSCSPGDPVQVTASPPQQESRLIGQPGDKTVLTTSEVARTTWFFHCRPSFEYMIMSSAETDGKIYCRMRVTAVKADLSLETTIWSPPDVPFRVTEHEEGHASIAREIYKNAVPIGIEAGKATVGREFEGYGKNQEEALMEAVNNASQAFCKIYRSKTSDVADRLSTFYDKLTDHGTNGMKASEAVQKTLSQLDHSW